jgi:hypothetical protein
MLNNTSYQAATPVGFEAGYYAGNGVGSFSSGGTVGAAPHIWQQLPA